MKKPYKEIINYLDGVWSKDFAIQKIQQNRRNYAKKQMTWFKRDQDISWFKPDNKDKIIDYIAQNIK